MIDSLLDKYKLKYEDLTPDEKETINVWAESLQKGQLTLSKIQEYIARMREEVSLKLSIAGLGKEEDMILKARLRNYILLEALLQSPAKAKEQIEKSLRAFSDKKLFK